LYEKGLEREGHSSDKIAEMVKQHSVDEQWGLDVYDLDDDEEPELLARLTEHQNLCLHAFEVKLAQIRRIVPHAFLSLIKIKNEERRCVAIAESFSALLSILTAFPRFHSEEAFGTLGMVFEW
jgi:hypothetical protein